VTVALGNMECYTVAPGETLEDVVQKLGLTVTQLLSCRDLLLAPGQCIPGWEEAEPSYMFPLQPVGVADYQQGHHDYPAVDIFAPIGTPFVAVTDGVIDALSREDLWDPTANDGALRGGLFVSMVGDDHVRYYGSHLSAVVPWLKPGMRVHAGQILGYVGKSGNARSTDSHLHFGISHPTFPEDWAVRRGEVDPYPYLEAWRTGSMLMPNLPPEQNQP
jgi:hypothetical protein